MPLLADGLLLTSQEKARAYFAVQAAAGTAWWVAVFVSADVRRWTLGDWSPGLLVVPDGVLFVGASAVTAWRAHRVLGGVVAVWTTTVTAVLSAYALSERVAGWGAVLMVVATIATWAATLTLWSGRLPLRWFFVGPFAFRVAQQRSRGRHLLRSLVQLVVFWSIFFLLVPYALATLEQRLRIGWPALDHPIAHWSGAIAFVVASGLGLWSCVSMALQGEGTPLPAETARNLVVVGPYRFVRNPMAVAGGIQTAGIGLWLGSWTTVVVAGAGALIWNTLIRPDEEADLAARFGAAYQAYRARVRCWIPTPPTTGSAR